MPSLALPSWLAKNKDLRAREQEGNQRATGAVMRRRDDDVCKHAGVAGEEEGALLQLQLQQKQGRDGENRPLRAGASRISIYVNDHFDR